ncbi:MAG: stage IV sporulation protein A [Bacilli bacterium]|nr:stage IV sporulation protein A [Bacilli bacterium]
MNEDIIQEVAKRTKGEIYLGVVGAVRSGKSTFIRRFMEQKVLPLISDQSLYQKIQDELPQSADGKTIMTVEPKFIPSNNVKITIGDDVNFFVRLVDCVGYVIPSSKGYQNEDGSSRTIQTPWSTEEMPFEEAAQMGTKKVIETHSNIGIVVTSDGSFGDFTRNEYEMIEEQIICELKEAGKPFVVVLNTAYPYDQKTLNLKEDLMEKYSVSVIVLDVVNMQEEDIDNLLKVALDEFDIEELNINLPNWVEVLNDEISFKNNFNQELGITTGNYRKMKDVFKIQEAFKTSGLFDTVEVVDINPGTGIVVLDLGCSEDVYNQVVEEILGGSIDDKAKFIQTIQDMQVARGTYDKVGPALKATEQCGYGISMPKVSDMVLSTPELIKQGGRYGIKIKATAPAIHLVQVEVESTFEPIIGSIEQSQALIDHMLEDYEEAPEKVWNSEIFGRKLCDVIGDGIRAKINSVPDIVQCKYKESLAKVVNSGKGGVISIIL